MTTRSFSYTCAGVTPTAAHGPDLAPPRGLPAPEAILGRAATENFRVASRLLGRDRRAHLLAIYGYARLVDYLGDDYPGDRLAALDWMARQTDLALADPARPGVHPLIAAAARTVGGIGADGGALGDLIAANRQDQVVTAYPTFDGLMAYCQLSANPIGRLVLAAFDADTPDRRGWSDAICSGLQLAEHWQDVAEDAARGRVYIPADDMARFGVGAAELSADPPASPGLRGLMAFQISRARRLLDTGFPLVHSLSGGARWAVAGFWAGGQAALDAVADRHFDPLRGAPRPSPTRVAIHLAAALRGPNSRREAA